MRTIVRIDLWNVAFSVVLLALLAAAAGQGMDIIAFGLPAVLAVWVLVLGSRSALRRWAIVACAVVGILLLLFQIAVCAFFALFQHGFRDTQSSTTWLVLIIYVVVGGALAVVWHLRAKLRNAPGAEDGP